MVQSGLTLLYFSISGLDLLGKLDEISAEATIEYIYSFQSPFDGHGGFYGYPKAGALKWFHDLRATYIIYHVSTTIHLVAYVCFVFICCPQKAITDKTYPLNSSYFCPVSSFLQYRAHVEPVEPVEVLFQVDFESPELDKVRALEDLEGGRSLWSQNPKIIRPNTSQKTIFEEILKSHTIHIGKHGRLSYVWFNLGYLGWTA